MSSQGRGILSVIQCPETRRVMRKALDGGFQWVGYTKSGHVEIRWPATGQVVHCASTPSDRNAWRALGRALEAASGLEILPHVKHRRSRKSLNPVDAEVEASRRRHAAQLAAEEQRLRQVEANRLRQQAAAERAAREWRHDQEIEHLMQPRWGR